MPHRSMPKALEDCTVTILREEAGFILRIEGNSVFRAARLDGCWIQDVRERVCDFAVFSDEAVCLIEFKCGPLGTKQVSTAREQLADAEARLRALDYKPKQVERVVYCEKLVSVVSANLRNLRKEGIRILQKREKHIGVLGNKVRLVPSRR